MGTAKRVSSRPHSGVCNNIAIETDADHLTPWERLAPADATVAYEMHQLQRSLDNLRSLGWIPRKAT